MNKKVILEALTITKKHKLTECRRFMNDNIKNVTTETELRQIIESLEMVEDELIEINKLMVEIEKQK